MLADKTFDYQPPNPPPKFNFAAKVFTERYIIYPETLCHDIKTCVSIMT